MEEQCRYMDNFIALNMTEIGLGRYKFALMLN
jgi:hypothetical protein